MPEPYVLVDRRPPVAVITLNKPAKLNAFTVADRSELVTTLERLHSDREVRAVVLTGAGRGFCAGADFTGQEIGPTVGGDSREQFIEPRGAWITRILDFDKPLIAAINGPVVGAGISIALACDIRISASDARIVPAWVDRGLAPDAGASYFLTHLLGAGLATELALTGEPIDAKRALEIRLVNRVVDPRELMTTALALAQTIAAKPPVTVAHIKRLMRVALEHSFDAQLLAESNALRACMATEDFQEALRAFREKRSPTFKGG